MGRVNVGNNHLYRIYDMKEFLHRHPRLENELEFRGHVIVDKPDLIHNVVYWREIIELVTGSRPVIITEEEIKSAINKLKARKTLSFKENPDASSKVKLYCEWNYKCNNFNNTRCIKDGDHNCNDFIQFTPK